MSAQLFRDDALRAHQGGWLARVQLARPLSLDLITLAVLAALAALVSYLWLASYTRKATVDGVLMPDRGLIRLVPTDAGTVLERRVAEGQAVRAGDVLFVLALERPRLLADAQADVKRSLAERQRSLQDAARQQEGLTASRLTALDARVRALDAESGQIDRELALQRERVDLAQGTLRRYEALRDENFYSDAQVRAKKEELLGQQAAAQALERQRSSLARERAQLDGERRSLPLESRSAQGGIERDLAALAREAAEQASDRQLVVRAPQDGVLSAVLAEPGQAVSPASPLASLLPQGATLQAQLYAPSSAIGFVRPGQAVRMRLEAFPYQKFGVLEGRVVQVSRTPLAAGEMATQALAGVVPGRPGEALFRITVIPDETSLRGWRQPLAAGMRLAADVRLEQRRLAEWLFEPLLGLRERW